MRAWSSASSSLLTLYVLALSGAFFPFLVSFLFFNRITICEVGAALVGRMPCMGVAGSTPTGMNRGVANFAIG